MRKATQMKLNVAEAFMATVDREVRWAEDQIASMKPEDFKDTSLREEIVELMSEVEKLKYMRGMYEEFKKLAVAGKIDEPAKAEATPEGESKFGFVKSFQKAA